MSYIMVDIESDGPIPGDYSMICFGAVVVEPGLERTFYGQLRPISEKFIPEALAVSGFTREQTLQFRNRPRSCKTSPTGCAASPRDRPMFISDNNGFDWQFVNWYFHHCTGGNPFGFSSTNLGSLYKGLVKDTSPNYKYLRRTQHTHHPLDDTKGNAGAADDERANGA